MRVILQSLGAACFKPRKQKGWLGLLLSQMLVMARSASILKPRQDLSFGCVGLMRWLVLGKR